MAALVNDEGITMDEFNAELERYKSAMTALKKTVADQDAAVTVLDDLIAQTLLAQAARQGGFNPDDAALQARIDRLAAQLGGPDQLSAWQQAHGYSDESFRAALKRSVEAAWMRDKIISAVPNTAEQVHVRQILLYNQEAADSILSQLQAGADFDTLAAQVDPVTRGDLGWFPQGYIFEPAVEQAAFSLDVGQTSQAIASEIGFHIIKVLDRQPDRPLSPDALLAMQNRVLADWVKNQRQQANIVLAP
jgi:peptidyl-prolyl cis-trans isomerase C